MKGGFKIHNKIIFILLVVGICLTAISCSVDIKLSEAEVASISIYSLSKIDGYVAGDEIDIYNAKILVVYNNGDKKIIDMTKDMLDYSSFDMSIPEEEKTIVVRYGKASTTFIISVEKWNFQKVELTQLPNKLIYVEGQSIDPQGAELSIYYDGGNIVKKSVTKDMLQAYEKNIGEQNIKINYYGANNLSFKVIFQKKTAIGLNIIREPSQVSVFQGYPQRLSRNNMKIRITYDNAVQEIFENPIQDSGGDIELIAYNRTKWANNIESNLFIYINDNQLSSSVPAIVAYKEPSISDTIVYEFTGTPKVLVGNIVNVGKAIATTDYLEDIISKSEGIVTEVTKNSVTVSRYVTHSCNITDIKENDIIKSGAQLGTHEGNNVFSLVSGIVTNVSDGKITIMALPVSEFFIAVTDKSYSKMEIIETPKTKKDKNSIYNIIQGDTLDLSTGKVRVTFDNGETEIYNMENSYIKIVNASTNLRKEIPGLYFTGITNQRNVPAGENYTLEYEIKYEEGYMYPNESITTIVSVVDDIGNINVSNNRIIVPEKEKNYTVSIVVTYTQENGEKLVSEASYIISAVGAESAAKELDISAAGKHILHIIFGGVANNYVEMEVTVIQKVPVGIIIEDTTNNISNHTFYLSDVLPFSTINYRIIYSNGEEDILPKGVMKNMVVNKSDDIGEGLTCDAVGKEQFIDIAVPNYNEIYQRLYFNVIALPIVDLRIIKEPLDSFLIGKGVSGGGINGINSLNLTGTNMTVSYLKGSTANLNDTSGNYTLLDLMNNYKNEIKPCIKITYKDTDVEPFTITEVYVEKKHYTAVLTYTDKYGESFDTEIKYYIVEKKPKNIKVSAKIYAGEYQYKSDYVQCEDWDFTGISLIATYDDDENSTTITETMGLEPYMVYDTDTNSIGKGIPLKIRFLGKMEDAPSLTFNVVEREETGIKINRKGKIEYTTTDPGLDLSNYQFAITFNAGTSQQVNGIYAFTGNAITRGWWYEVYGAEIKVDDTEPSAVFDNAGNLVSSSMRLTGYKMIRLKHTSEYEIRGSNGQKRYNIRYVDFFIKVDFNTSKIQKIVFDDTMNYHEDGLPILGTFAVGMPLVYNHYDLNTNTLREKFIKIIYEDGTIGTLELTNSDVSVDYRTDDLSIGYRSVTISYDIHNCMIYALIRNADLVNISLTTMPTTNFIRGSEITVDGGILKATYKVKNSEETFSNYVLMNKDTPLLKYSEIDSNIEEIDNYGKYLQYVKKTINITYGTISNNITTDYEITIYNKQDVKFIYGNVIFFYGNAKPAIAISQQVIPEFDLPDDKDITLNYVSSEHFIYYTPEEFEIAKLSNPNLAEIIMLDEFGNEVICYVDLRNVIKPDDTPNRPYTPVKSGFTYYIMMMVKGNNYYRQRNYCYQTYLIIPKVVEVNVVSANERAYVMRLNTNNNPKAISYMYANINSINSKYTAAVLNGVPNPDYHSYIQKIELASPNKNYFEILMSLTSEYNEETHYEQINIIFSQIEAQINSQATIQSKKIVKGVNIAEYNGGQPDYITYTIASGETLTLGGVLELLNGKLEIVLKNGVYGVGDYNITNSNASLFHNNYNIDLVMSKDTIFRVIPNRVLSMAVDKMIGGTVTITDGGFVEVQVTPVEGVARIINSYEISYYTDPSRTTASKIEGLPRIMNPENSTEIYYAQLNIGYYVQSDGETPYPLEFTVIVNAAE